MLRKYLKEAYNNALEVIVQLDYCCNARFIGRVMDLDNEHFQLFHMSEYNAMSWIFKIDSIMHMGVYNYSGVDFMINTEINEQRELKDGN